MLIVRCTVGGVVPLLVFRIDGKCKEWEANLGASSGDVWHGESWRRQSARSMCWAAHGHQGLTALKFWIVVCWGILPWLHNSNECFTHREYGNCTRIGSGEEKPWEKPYWIGLTHLGEDLPECDVPLLSHPGPLVLLLLGHPGPLVLLFFGPALPVWGVAPTHVVTWLGWQRSTWAACTGVARKVEIRQLKCPLTGWLCPKRGGWKTPMGNRQVGEDLHHHHAQHRWVLWE